MKIIRKKKYSHYWIRHLEGAAVAWMIIMYLLLQTMYFELFSSIGQKSTVNFYEGTKFIQSILRDSTVEDNESMIAWQLRQMSIAGTNSWVSDILGGHSEILAIRLNGWIRNFLTIPSGGYDGSGNIYIGGSGKEWAYLLNKDGDIILDSTTADELTYLYLNPLNKSGNIMLFCYRSDIKDLAEKLNQIAKECLDEYQKENPKGPARIARWRMDECYIKGSGFYPSKMTLILEDGNREAVHFAKDRLPDIAVYNYMVDTEQVKNLSEYDRFTISPNDFYTNCVFLYSDYEQKDLRGWKVDDEFREEAKQGISSISHLSNNEDSGDSWSEGNPLIYFLNGQMCFARSAVVTDSRGEEYRICVYQNISGLLRGNIDNCLFHGGCIAVILILLSFGTAYIHYSQKKHIFMTQAYRNTLMDSMAHDLKSPLMTIGGYAENLTSHIHDEKREHYAQEIQKSVAYMNDIVTKNLDILKFSEEHKRIKRTNINIGSLFEETFEKYQSLMSDKKLSLKTQGSLVTKGDRELLSKAVENLVTNAVRYAPEGGTIYLTLDKRSFSIKNDSSIEYEGNLKELWEPFVRGDDSRTGKGTGLGLSIVANVLDKHSWKYKLRFDKEKKIFSCEVHIPWGLIF